MNQITSIISGRNVFLNLVFLTLVVFAGFAQNNYNIQFQNETIPMPENIGTFQWSDMPETARHQQGYYGWIQFYETPSQNIQDQFKNNGLKLIEYIPHQTYLFYFPAETSISFLRNNNVRSIIAVPPTTKLSTQLKNPPYDGYAMEGNNILVTLEFHKSLTAQYVIDDLANQQIALKQQYKGANILDLSIPDNCLDDLSALPYVKWVELIVAPPIKDDTRGRSLHRANGLDTQTSAGRNYTGDGIGVMVRDDGILGPHIDFQGRLDNSGASGAGGSHGDGVGGIMAGAGNLDPTMRGMAAGSDVYVVNYVSNFLDAPTQNLINTGTVQITNSSYSNGCNDGYTSITRTVDQQMNNIPSLLHVFSAGNSNGSNCGYGAGTQWGNITGGHKQGKNVIATANTNFSGSLTASSSRGPAHDGRIKPDIAANGTNHGSTNENNTYQSFGGTSGAAPGIAGVSAQLYEAYADINGSLPDAALVKATLLNTANDAGNVGPDYKFGWGIVNGLRAGKLIEDGRYLLDDITQGTTNTHTIVVPAGTTQARFMVYWSDPEAAPGADPALVNDLDLVVNDPSNNDLLPWILDPTPNATTLNLPATNGEDHLNNMEQVLINSPAAGSYDIEISGFNVPMGPQEYYVVYEFIQENLVVTYPNDGESFVPGEAETLYWDATNTTSSFLIEYSIDNGGTWNSIVTVGSTSRHYSWNNIPSSITGEAKIRVTSGSFQDESDGVFSIAEQPDNFEFSQVCPSQATFAWDAVPGAEEYDVYLLGTTYMEVVGTTASNTITVPISSSTDPQWASIVAKNNTDGWESRRIISINHPGGLLNCSLANDVAIMQINNSAADFSTICSGSSAVTVSATVQNAGIDPQTNFTVGYQLNSEPLVTETFTATINSGDLVVYEFATPINITTSGPYTLTVFTDLTGDQNPSNDEAVLDFFALTEATALDFEEPFDVNGFPPAAWSILNDDNDDTWEERTGVPGSSGSNTVTAYINNFNYNAPGEEDIIQTEIFDLTATGSYVLGFDLAKAQYSSTLFDSLRVEVSIDCGDTFVQVYSKTDLDLSTVPNYVTTIWTPSSSNDWRLEEIDLTSYAGEVVMVRFINVNNYGNSTFIDNVNVRSGVLDVEDKILEELVMYPNPTSNEVFIKLGNVIFDDVSITVANSLGQSLQTIKATAFNNANTAVINVSSYASGMYFVTIKMNGQSVTKKLLIE